MVLQSYLSIADILYSGHLAIADRIFWSRQNPYKFLIQKPLYSGHGYSGHLVIADKIIHYFDQLYLFIADTEKNWISINHKINPKPHFDPIFQHSPSHTIPTTPLFALHICAHVKKTTQVNENVIFLYFIHFFTRWSSSFSIVSIFFKIHLIALTFPMNFYWAGTS